MSFLARRRGALSRFFTTRLRGGTLSSPLGGEDQVKYPNFSTNTSVASNNLIRAVSTQPEGRILISGDFTSWAGSTVNRIVRLNNNGTRDVSFTTNMGTGPDDIAWEMVTQADGKTIIAGNFTLWSGATVNRIVRLNPDGTRDTDFSTNTGTGANALAWALAVQSDGKILIGGDFTEFNGTSVNRVIRLNADGTEDTAFTANLGTAANQNVREIVVQPDGKILIGGDLLQWNGVTANRILRLNADGTRDTAFTTNNGTAAGSGEVWTVRLQSDGKILLGGAFTTWNGTTVNRIVRLNADGTRDTAFTANTGTGSNSTIVEINLQSDGRIIVLGPSTWNGATVPRVIRLNVDGTLDTSFVENTGSGPNALPRRFAILPDDEMVFVSDFTAWNGTQHIRIIRLDANGTPYPVPGANNTVQSVIVQPDGKVLVGGQFTIWAETTANRIFRLNADLTRDTSFITNTGTAANNTVWVMAIQSDGKILVGGLFTTFNGVTVNRIVRLNSDGSPDTAFTTNTGAASNSDVYSIVVQSDGKILVGGNFTTWNGTSVNRVIRLNADGTEDTAFTANLGTAASGTVWTIAVQSDGKILLGGNFVTWNGTTVNRIVRLNADGTQDSDFTTNTGTGPTAAVRVMTMQLDGKILVGGEFFTWNGTSSNRILRLNSNGTRDTGFAPLGAGGGGSIYSIVVQQNNRIVVGGTFTSWGFLSNRNRLVRIFSSNGAIDEGFNANVGSAADNVVWSIAEQSEGNLLAGGQFTSWNGNIRYRLLKLGGGAT
jgi:uncharacterized delta-60 repeat protein